MNKALLDTDIFSEYLKGHDQRVRQNAAIYRQLFGSLTISVVTAMEIIKGLHKMRREQEIQALLGRLASEEVFAFDIAASEYAGRIHADLERMGQPIGWADIVIAAIALRHGLELVTGNTAHYQRIQQIGHPLVLINWRL
jgi:predicted nucleic acid-binding protein